nr:uncharacterized protein LOC127347572 [Lolium perenne]
MCAGRAGPRTHARAHLLCSSPRPPPRSPPPATTIAAPPSTSRRRAAHASPHHAAARSPQRRPPPHLTAPPRPPRRPQHTVLRRPGPLLPQQTAPAPSSRSRAARASPPLTAGSMGSSKGTGVSTPT